MMKQFYKEEPTQTKLFACPSCQGIIPMGIASCRYCGIQIDAATALKLNADFKLVTDAVASANTLKQSIWAAVILTAASGWYLVAYSYPDTRVFLFSAAPVPFIGYGLNWHRKYGSLDTRDSDYPDAVKSMRVTLVVWVVALLLQIAFLAYVFSRGARQR